MTATRFFYYQLAKVFFLVCFSISLFAQSDINKRKAYLEELKPLLKEAKGQWAGTYPITPHESNWEEWQKRTGELPPDFDGLPSHTYMQDPLIMLEQAGNIAVRSLQQWEHQKQIMSERIKHWLTGAFPPKPDNLLAKVTREDEKNDVRVRHVELSFGPEHKATLDLELYIPPGEGPFPVFLTPGANAESWISITQAVSRGYIGVLYAACDAKDDSQPYMDIWYPDYDFSALMRRAWAAHRAVDYLYMQDIVNKDQIGLTGLSRDGKQVLFAAAFDKRIDAVVVCSGGTGGEDPFRYTSPQYDNETLEAITANFSHWLHPRLRFFAGREHKLPFDQHFLSSLVAPRGLMLSSSIFEDQGNPWGIQQHFDVMKPVFEFLGKPDHLHLHMRHGYHRPAMRDVHTYVDFFDYVFGRSAYLPPVKRYYDYSFAKWQGLSGELIYPGEFPDRSSWKFDAQNWAQEKQSIKDRMKMLLGAAPTITNHSFRAGLDYLGDVIRRPGPPEGAKSIELHIGQLQYMADAEGNPVNKNMPVVIYLHEYAYPTGYGRQSWELIHALLRAGFAVYMQDQIGFGTRIEEGQDFYRRYPHWSKLGAMVADVGHAINGLERLDFVESDHIYAVGYALGGKIGLWSAALDERLKGVATICAFTPLRAKASPDRAGTEVYSHLHGLVPKLGFFIGEEAHIPVDYDEIIASIAPRPLYIIAPSIDREADADQVKQAVDEAAKAYKKMEASSQLRFEQPNDVNRFSSKMQEEVIAWLKEQVK